MNTEVNECRETEEFTRLFNSAEDTEKFAAFIIYCLARLDKGDTVQAIWNDYQALDHDT